MTAVRSASPTELMSLGLTPLYFESGLITKLGWSIITWPKRAIASAAPGAEYARVKP